MPQLSSPCCVCSFERSRFQRKYRNSVLGNGDLINTTVRTCDPTTRTVRRPRMLCHKVFDLRGEFETRRIAPAQNWHGRTRAGNRKPATRSALRPTRTTNFDNDPSQKCFYSNLKFAAGQRLLSNTARSWICNPSKERFLSLRICSALTAKATSRLRTFKQKNCLNCETQE